MGHNGPRNYLILVAHCGTLWPMNLTHTIKVRVSESMYQRLEVVQKKLFSEDTDKSRLVRVALTEWLQKVEGQSRARPETARRAPSEPVSETVPGVEKDWDKVL